MHSSTPTIILFCAALALPAWPQPPEILWTQTYGGPDQDAAGSVLQTADGGFILAGHTQISPVGDYDVYLVKTDEQGDLLWSRTYGGSAWDDCRGVEQTADGGYVLGGYTCSFGAGGSDMYLLKMDSLGNLQWQQTFGGDDLDDCYSVQPTSDSGYILGGYTISSGAGRMDFFLVKADSLGNLAWQQTFGGNADDRGHAAQQISDGGYAIAGFTESFGSGRDVYLVKTDSAGNLIWTSTFGGDGIDDGYALQETTDGGFILAGNTTSLGSGGHDLLVIKCDSLGNLIWQQAVGGVNNDRAHSVQHTPDSGYILGGDTRTFSQGDCDGLVVKTNGLGEVEWQITYGAAGEDKCRCVRPLNDGYIAAGWKTNPSGFLDAYLMRLNGLGPSVPLSISASPLNPPVQIFASGGSFSYELVAVNGGPLPYVLAVWCMTVLPNGSLYGPTLGPASINLPGAFILSRTRNQYVPPNAPPGVYTVYALLGTYPNILWSCDSFTFAKLAELELPPTPRD
jgi:hypothetical protein